MPQTAESILDRPCAWGVGRIFGYPGDGINSLLDAFPRAEGAPGFIRTRNEEMTAFMATAHAKRQGDLEEWGEEWGIATEGGRRKPHEFTGSVKRPLPTSGD